MQEISTINNSKTEWNMNETHILIPMMDGDVTPNKEPDKINTNTITVNTFDGGDQAVLTNGLETSLLIGLDKNLFETDNNKSDFIVIQNTELKSPVAYALSYVDQDKSEIFWESAVLKDRIKEWCANDKAVFEVKDILSTETKENNQINLDDTDLTSLVCKGKFSEENLRGERTCREEIENEALCIENCVQDSKIFGKETCEQTSKPTFSLIRIAKIPENEKSRDFSSGKEPRRIFTSITEDYDGSITSTCETDIIKQATKDDKNMTVSSSLPEKSLPLKKKAKMKTTMTLGSENVWSSKLQVNVTHHENKNCTEQNLELISESSNSDSSKSLVKKTKKRQGGKGRNSKVTTVKDEMCESLVSKSKQEEEFSSLDENQMSKDGITDELFRNNLLGFDERKVNSIADLVEELRRSKMINASVWQTLLSGLKEMNVDIFHEVVSKKQENVSPKSSSYSVQLKAFALVLHFKQPAAFNYLAKLYGNGWPSLDVIKEWKRRLNNHQRPNFMGVQREAS